MHMRQQLERRLAVLRNEYANGQKQAAELESRLNSVRATLDRINAAIQEIERQLALPAL
jgi:septal ring factor EnvC (AmiA/AmiB activator)